MRPVVITRAARAAPALADAVAKAGFAPLVFPTLEIGPAPDPAGLGAVLADIARFKLVIFVSPNAIHGALAARAAPWPRAVAIGVMGPGSVAALTTHGVERPHFRIISPEETALAPDDPLVHEAPSPEALRFDSESLYRQLDTAALAPGPVLIVKGNGGRTWLYDALVAAGVAVETVQSYTRTLPVPSPAALARLSALVEANEAAQLLVTSSESLGNLLELIGGAGGPKAVDWARAQRLIVPHARIAENATSLGFASVVLSGPGDANIVRALK